VGRRKAQPALLLAGTGVASQQRGDSTGVAEHEVRDGLRGGLEVPRTFSGLSWDFAISVNNGARCESRNVSGVGRRPAIRSGKNGGALRSDRQSVTRPALKRPARA
jgi:hypothetical protein